MVSAEWTSWWRFRERALGGAGEKTGRGIKIFDATGSFQVCVLPSLTFTVSSQNSKDASKDALPRSLSRVF